MILTGDSSSESSAPSSSSSLFQSNPAASVAALFSSLSASFFWSERLALAALDLLQGIER